MKNQKFFGKLIAIALFVVLMAGLLFYANHDRPRYTITESTGVEYETARVLEVASDDTVEDETLEGVKKGKSELKIELLTGRYQGDTCYV